MTKSMSPRARAYWISLWLLGLFLEFSPTIQKTFSSFSEPPPPFPSSTVPPPIFLFLPNCPNPLKLVRPFPNEITRPLMTIHNTYFRIKIKNNAHRNGESSVIDFPPFHTPLKNPPPPTPSRIVRRRQGREYRLSTRILKCRKFILSLKYS